MDSFIGKILFVIVLVVSLLVYIDYYDINLNEPSKKTKVTQEVIVETFC